MQSTEFQTAVHNLLRLLKEDGRLPGSDLQQLAGRLSEVADDAFQGFALRLVGDGVQVDGACRPQQEQTQLLVRKDSRAALGGGQRLFFLTLISAIVEDVQSVDGLFASLLATKDQIDPLVEVTGHVFTLLEFKTTTPGHFKLLIFDLS